jgi:hypothetical protein
MGVFFSFMKLCVQHAPRFQELTEMEKYQLLVKEALDAYQLDNYLRATGKYQAALELLNTSAELVSSCTTHTHTHTLTHTLTHTNTHTQVPGSLGNYSTLALSWSVNNDSMNYDKNTQTPSNHKEIHF